MLTSNKEKELIIEDEDRFVSKYVSPVVEYTPSKIRDEKVYVGGRLVYLQVMSFLSLRKRCYPYSENSRSIVGKINIGKVMVFETIGDEATVFIPNRVVLLKRD